ncbi:RNA polymerase sigma factor [Alicyclobacillus fodiniaquatilis]|jgi:RNA polymerase sigma-70 factor (ECF subfamily)|uniref:RNA polymerase sigma factor n=1 Tax=Alicyclobacillus fodiniaquatilis TaxID=1661150 RepID=A0ABW4JEA1_9BACL
MDDFQSSTANAIKDLFEKYGDEVYQYVRYTLGDAIQAEDVVQEIFLRALQAWPRFEHRSSSRTWLWSIVRNYLSDVLRRKKRNKRFTEIDLEIMADTLSVSDSFASVELDSVLQSVPAVYRQVIILRIIQDKTSKEVAELLGWTENKVRVTLHRALKKLQHIIGENELVSVSTHKGRGRHGIEQT